MITLVRKAYKTVTELYEIDLDKEYVDSVNERLKKIAVHPEELPEITDEFIASVYNHSYNYADYDEAPKFEFYYSWYETDGTRNTYHTNLYDWLEGFINDDMWDSYIECLDADTDDVYDSIRER